MRGVTLNPDFGRKEIKEVLNEYQRYTIPVLNVAEHTKEINRKEFETTIERDV